MHFSEVWPLPTDAVAAALRKSRRNVTIEGNATGQLAGLIRRETGIKMDATISKFDGRPFSPSRDSEPAEKGGGLMVAPDAYNSNVPIAWCPGCGNFGILQAVKRALVALNLEPRQVLFVSGIGQAPKLPHYTQGNVFNGLHGRSFPPPPARKSPTTN